MRGRPRGKEKNRVGREVETHIDGGVVIFVEILELTELLRKVSEGRGGHFLLV